MGGGAQDLGGSLGPPQASTAPRDWGPEEAALGSRRPARLTPRSCPPGSGPPPRPAIGRVPERGVWGRLPGPSALQSSLQPPAPRSPVTWGRGDSRFRSVWQPRKPTGVWPESAGHQHELGQAGSRGAVASAGPLGLHSTGSHCAGVSAPVCCCGREGAGSCRGDSPAGFPTPACAGSLPPGPCSQGGPWRSCSCPWPGAPTRAWPSPGSRSRNVASPAPR